MSLRSGNRTSNYSNDFAGRTLSHSFKLFVWGAIALLVLIILGALGLNAFVSSQIEKKDAFKEVQINSQKQEQKQ